MKQFNKKGVISTAVLTCGAILLSVGGQNVNADEAPQAGTSEPAVAETNTHKADTDVDKGQSQQNPANNKEEATTPSPAGAESGAPAGTDQPVPSSLEGVTQATVVGEDPVLGINTLTAKQWQDLHQSVDSSESLQDQGIDLHWKTKLDVSKTGTSVGEAEITYSNLPSPDDLTPAKKTLLVKVKVEVQAGQKKTADEVRNRITYLDQDNKVIVSYSWVGKKGTRTPEWQFR